MVKVYQEEFIELARACDALKFGQFTLKSGRRSPYFFNAGAFNTGPALATLGRCYAAAIVDSGMEFDVMMGPAYKGIPLVVSTAIAFAEQHGRDVPIVYNRKEAKDHGEGGMLVGANLEGRVLVVDDVITAGTALREAVSMVEAAGARCCGVAVGLDRQERGDGARSAIQDAKAELGLKVVSIVDLASLIDYMQAKTQGNEEILAAMVQYRSQYGVL